MLFSVASADTKIVGQSAKGLLCGLCSYHSALGSR